VFDLDQFVNECRAAMNEDVSMQALREVVARAVSEPNEIMNALGEPARGHMQKLHHAVDLTVLNVVWLPNMTLFPHNHNMAAVIGIYSGREDNIFWRRVHENKIEAAGAKALSDKDAVTLGRDIIHSVTNPISRFTGALHVYAGDFFNEPRSEWNPETLAERPCDPQRIAQLFETQDASAFAKA